MKNRSPVRHNPEKIKGALAQLDAGKSLTEVAAELGVSKGLVSYWRANAERLLADPGTAGQGKGAPARGDARTLKFIEKCWTSIGLAFRRLDAELKGDKPHGVRDLALCIAVLADKMAQARQNAQAHAAPTAAGWSVSEDTWLLLRRHREAKAEPAPAEKIVEGGLEASGLEPQKGEAAGGPGAAAGPSSDDDSSRRVRIGGS